MILFWANDVSVVCVFRCGLTRGMLSGERVLALIFMIMIDGLPKIVSNWAVLTVELRPSTYDEEYRVQEKSVLAGPSAQCRMERSWLVAVKLAGLVSKARSSATSPWSLRFSCVSTAQPRFRFSHSSLVCSSFVGIIILLCKRIFLVREKQVDDIYTHTHTYTYSPSVPK